jgi:proline iminopeptidase
MTTMRSNTAAPLLGLCALAAGLVACELHDPSEAGNLVPKTVDEDSSLPSLALAGTVFHYETRGDPTKPAVIILHGGPGGDYRGYLRLADRHDGYALSDDHFLVFWDQRGSGLSRRHTCDTYSLDVMDADLDALVDHVSPGRPVFLVGHSWGAMYATFYIDRHPEKVAGAVLMEPGPLNAAMFDVLGPNLYDIDVFSEWLNDDAWDSQFLSPDDQARADYHRLLGVRDAQPKFHQSTQDPDPVWRLGAIAYKCLTKSGIKDGKATYDFTDHLAAYPTRVLFMASAWNEVIGVAFQERQRQYFPSSDLVTIPNAGHDFQWTQTAATLAAIHAYLDRLASAKVAQ